ncbi:MAG: nuclear transport factor 2 family protein [Planctomycetota bacterium]|jgi:ketosteroid isomerase-like protein
MIRHAVLLLLCAGCASAEIGRVLDSFHDAAAGADEERYFAHFAPEGVFLGTDARERWTVEEFRAYAHPHFANGDGWTYRPRDRHIEVFGDIARFDELLDHESYGELRGSGVLRRIDGQWKIAQYNLAFTVPNEKARDVVDRIRSGDRPAER